MTLSLPFRCYKKTLTEEFEKAGIILDEEDEDSDGYIENKGSSYKIHLYSRPKDLQPFIDIPRKVEMMKNGN